MRIRGCKEERLGGDDAVRPGYPATPAELDSAGDWVFRAHQQLIGLRRNHPWLVTARTSVTELDNTRICYQAQGADDSQRLTVKLELAAEPTATIADAEGNVLWATTS